MNTPNIYILFIQRFHIPILVWVLVAFDYHDCHTFQVILPILILGNAVYKVYHSYNTWYKQMACLMVSDSVPSNKFYFWVAEMIIQLLTGTLTYWWVDDVHTCISLNRINRGYLFLLLLCGVFVLHVLHDKRTKEYKNDIMKKSFAHL